MTSPAALSGTLAALSLAPPLVLALAAVAGLLLGIVYFGGLWLTVRRLATARRPALLLVASLGARVAILLAGMYLVMDGRADRLIACLVGVVAARLLLARAARPPRAPRPDAGVRGTGSTE